MMSWQFEPIGVIESCFKEKFGIPRQPGLAKSAPSVLRLNPEDPFLGQALRRLDEFSHLWVIYVFHSRGSRGWKPSIRPPRLGGAEKVGVLASRSPHRPNPIGLSVVQFVRLDLEDPRGPAIHVLGGDFLDGSPILDIKPYLPYADSLPHASSGWAEEPIIKTPVVFSARADACLAAVSDLEMRSQLRAMIVEILELDPRPAFQKRRLPATSPEAHGLDFGFALLEYDIKWRIDSGQFLVTDLVKLGPAGSAEDSSPESLSDCE
ncbi:MAG: tRNA ((37)-N6)-methyltransferase TrmO [Pseudomonadota bacterium]|jgi:tRNA-Thr(GGU) m(6)t(6)A37 methyltransferase TsaA